MIEFNKSLDSATQQSKINEVITELNRVSAMVDRNVKDILDNPLLTSLPSDMTASEVNTHIATKAVRKAMATTTHDWVLIGEKQDVEVVSEDRDTYLFRADVQWSTDGKPVVYMPETVGVETIGKTVRVRIEVVE